MNDKTGKAVAPSKSSKNEIAAQGMDFLSQAAEQGRQSLGMADILLPRITILQQLSPQVNRRSPDYIEGAEAGKICNVATGQLADELLIIPCAYIRHHIEWAPNRGGFIRDHGENENVMGRVVKQNDQKFDVLDNGNLIVPTPTFYAIDVATGQQIIVPMARTQAKAAKKLNSLWTSLQLNHPTNGPFAAPMWARSYKLVPVERTEDGNTWFVFTVVPDAMILELSEKRPDLVPSCVAFQKLVLSGEVRASAADFGEEEGGQGGGQAQSGGGTGY